MSQKPTSPYYRTPVTDFYLDILQYRPIDPTDDDRKMVITPKYDGRPDIMAYDVYGTPRLWWVFAIRNPDLLIDPVNDFRAGVEIMVPPASSIEDIRR